MGELHQAFNEAMLAPNFFSDAPSGSSPKPKTETIQTSPPQTNVVNPVDQHTLPPFQVFSDFPKQHELVMPPLLCDGLLHVGSKGIFAGESKTGKSWAVMDLGISVATGMEFWGRSTNRRSVLFMDFELQPCFAQFRLWSVLHGKGLTNPPSNFHYWPLRGRCYDPDRVLSVLEERMAGIPDLGLIIADPVYKLSAGRDENDNTKVTELLLTLEKFSEKTGACFLFTHHYSKSGSTSDQGRSHYHRMSGAASWARDPDSIITMSHLADHPNCLKVECTMRNLRSPDPFAIEFDPPGFHLRDDIEIPKGAVSKSPVEASQVLAILAEAGSLTPEEWQARTIKNFGITRSQFDKIASKLRATGAAYIANSTNGYVFKAEEK